MSIKVGVAIPCHIDDIDLCERYPLSTLRLLRTRPHKVLVDINNGGYKGLKEIRTRMFDKLFNLYGCDVVLSVCVDYRIINKNLISEIPLDKVMNYGRFFNTPIIGLMHYMARRLTRTPWSSMYSIPKKVWFEEVRDNPLWNGYDGDIPRCVNMNYISHMGINYMLMRRNTKRLIAVIFSPAYMEKGIIRRILKLIQGIKI